MTIPEISGGSLTFAISQNFFVGGETTTAFYGKATQEKECMEGADGARRSVAELAPPALV
jgi:hypothetical protein